MAAFLWADFEIFKPIKFQKGELIGTAFPYICSSYTGCVTAREAGVY